MKAARGLDGSPQIEDCGLGMAFGDSHAGQIRPCDEKSIWRFCLGSGDHRLLIKAPGGFQIALVESGISAAEQDRLFRLSFFKSRAMFWASSRSVRDSLARPARASVSPKEVRAVAISTL